MLLLYESKSFQLSPLFSVSPSFTPRLERWYRVCCMHKRREYIWEGQGEPRKIYVSLWFDANPFSVLPASLNGIRRSDLGRYPGILPVLDMYICMYVCYFVRILPSIDLTDVQRTWGGVR